MASFLPLHSKRGSRTTRVPKNLTMHTFSFFNVLLFFIFSTFVAAAQLQQPSFLDLGTHLLQQPLVPPPPAQSEQPSTPPPTSQSQQPLVPPPPAQSDQPSAPPPLAQSQQQLDVNLSQQGSVPPPPAQSEQPSAPPPQAQSQQQLGVKAPPPPAQSEQPSAPPPQAQSQQQLGVKAPPPPAQSEQPSALPPQTQSQQLFGSNLSQQRLVPPPPAQSKHPSAPPPPAQPQHPSAPITGHHGRRRRNAAKFFGYVRTTNTTYLQNQTELAAEFLHAHNFIRNEYKLPALAWDNSLASFAKKYLMERYNDCECIHSNSNYGENLFWGKKLHWTPCDAVYYWYMEKNSYNFNTLQCEPPPKMCGHFTQIVWRDTTHVGCALQHCKNSGNTGVGMLIVCEYYPPGNFPNENPLVHAAN